MTTLLMATADLPLDPGGWEISTAQARTGSASFKTPGLTNITHAINLGFDLQNQNLTLTELYWRFCFYNTNAAVPCIYARVSTQSEAIISVVGLSSTNLELRVGNTTGTLLHTVTNGVPLNTWVVSEVYFNTTTVRWRYNGTQIYENTEQSITLTDIARINFSGRNSTSFWRGHVDDIVVCTDKWPGLGGLHVFPPTGAGSVTQWAGSLPTLSTPTVGNQHRFTIDDAPATAAHIHRIGVGLTAKVTGQGYGAIRPTLNGDTTADELALSISPQYTQRYWPGVSLPQFNDSEIGVQRA